MYILCCIVEDDTVHTNLLCSFYIDGLVVSEDAFLGLEAKLFEQMLVNFRLRLEKMHFRRDNLSIEQVEDVVVLHHLVHLAAPIGKTIEFITAGLQFFQKQFHTGHLVRHKIHILVEEYLKLLGVFRILLLFAADDVDKRGDFAIQFVDELQRGEEGVELLSVLLVVEERVDDVCEVVIDEHFSEVEYQGFDHCLVLNVCFASSQAWLLTITNGL